MLHRDRGELYLVTGYPRFLVRGLVREILEKDPAGVIALLVQEKHEREARIFTKRVGAVRRIRVVTGDVANMHLGLSTEEYRVLAKNVTTIFHAASITYPGVVRAEATRVNVEGTRNVLEFAADSSRIKRFNHFSSAFVSGERTGAVLESELDRGQGFTSPIYKSIFLAEREVRRAKWLSPSILRSSIIVGDSRTGETDKLDVFYAFLEMIADPSFYIPLPAPSGGGAPFNVVPVDYVTKAAVEISSKADAAGKTFHLVDPKPPSVRIALEKIASRVGKPGLPIISVQPIFVRLLSKTRYIRKRHPLYMNALEILGRNTIYDNRNTTEALEGTGISCPPFETYMGKIVDYVKTRINWERERDVKDALA